MNSCKEVNKKVDEREQWLLQGNCDLCRKKEYCLTMCSARHNYLEKYTMNEIQSKIMKRFFGGKNND